MKRWIFVLMFVLLPLMVFAADQTVVNMTEDATPGTDSLLYCIDDPGGSPVDRKCTMQNVLKLVTHTFSRTITNPTTSDGYYIVKLPKASTITSVTGMHFSGTSVVFNILECSASKDGCANILNNCTTTTEEVADPVCTITDASIAANGWLRINTVTVNGAVTYYTFVITYTQTE